MPALAYFLTFSTYGTHLPGSEKGWVDKRHRQYGSPVLESNSNRRAYWEARLKETPCTLDSDARRIALDALLSVCSYREWHAHAVHVRMTHIHAVVAGEAAPERMLSDFKGYATRALRHALPIQQRCRYWTNHGSTRYLWNAVSVKAAIDYVLNGQGERMACYPAQTIQVNLGR